MRSERVGRVLVSVWCVANLVVALVVTAMTLAGSEPPALRLVMEPHEIARVDPRALDVIAAQAAIANPCIAALCVLVLVLVRRREYATVASVLVPLQAFGFVSDGFLGHRNLAVNLGSTALLLAGLALLLRLRRLGE
jgi:hypothetical protein